MASSFARGLRDALQTALERTSDFWTPIAVLSVHVEGVPPHEELVLQFRTQDGPTGQVYGVRLPVSEYAESGDDPTDWRGYLHDEVMELVDARPGLPAPDSA